MAHEFLDSVYDYSLYTSITNHVPTDVVQKREISQLHFNS